MVTHNILVLAICFTKTNKTVYKTIYVIPTTFPVTLHMLLLTEDLRPMI